MKYLKPALSFSQQADLLIKRGLFVDKKEDLVNFLSQVNFYRFTGYCYTFKTIDPNTSTEKFITGTKFETIKLRYEFDSCLRGLLMNAIEMIEIAILRTKFVESHSLQYGPFGYTVYKNFNPRFSPSDHAKLISDIECDEKRSYEEFINRYRKKYTSEKSLPLWMAVEIMSFGQLFTLYRNSDHSIKKNISSQMNLFPPVLDSWLHTLNYIRNACAHHVRLWNRSLPIAPTFPDKKHDPSWYIPISISNTGIFGVLSLTQYLLIHIDPSNNWKHKVFDLIVKYPQIPINMMGFPKNWESLIVWR